MELKEAIDLAVRQVEDAENMREAILAKLRQMADEREAGAAALRDAIRRLGR